MWICNLSHEQADVPDRKVINEESTLLNASSMDALIMFHHISVI